MNEKGADGLGGHTAPKRPPHALVFVCSENSVRSPMAEALTRHYYGSRVYVASAGLRRGDVDPFAAAVLAEAGIQMPQHEPHTLADLDDESFDLIVSLSPEAHDYALQVARDSATDVVYWPTPDPTRFEGPRDRVLDSYRRVRDGLAARIKELFEPGSGTTSARASRRGGED